MDPRKISELEPFLKEHHLQPKISLSQNFLIDTNILKKIVKAANLQGDEEVLEIGPGPGALTKTLIEENHCVTAIEIDKNYANLLNETIQSYNLKVIHQDFLEFIPNKKYVVVANIPYHISTKIIYHLVDHIQFYSRIFLTVQKQFAERILTLKPSNATSIFIDYYFEASICFTISKNCFYPKPKDPSVVLCLIPKNKNALVDEKEFFDFVQFLFHEKRKMIRSILKDPILTDKRPEALQVIDFIELYLFLKKQNKVLIPKKE